MAENQRLAMLREILEQDPANTLARYGIAMEYAGMGETETALGEFKGLISRNPEYANAYFMAAQTLHKVERDDEAKAMLKGGIEAAQRAGNKHAESEMQAMLDELEFEY
jgi:Tfp pilus assembly protein PilF